ncbi:hypothetical protein LX32DRAFT_410736 [Colletotrichum zoysiae]|uniref:Uncharacterized protein n=1 Tax=Colletotrichum zoysiae TaxID=1216348 RepID=A0AAD9HGZ8_9PEZI|nr:hypothetical protein LX32DRAFT_410736 [Colletotrichum zoysiae]
MFPHIDHTYVSDLVFKIGNRSEDKQCTGNPSIQDPVSMLRLYAPSADAWDVTDPSHRGCFIGQPCCVTGAKSCARTSYLSKFHHAYGTCYKWSPGHIHCSDSTSESEKHIFPSCVECGVLVEIWDLILINRRLLDDKKQVTTAEDFRVVRNSVGGYIKAYELRRSAHVTEIRNRADNLFEAQVSFAKVGVEEPAAKSTSWWVTFIERLAAFL